MSKSHFLHESHPLLQLNAPFLRSYDPIRGIIGTARAADCHACKPHPDYLEAERRFKSAKTTEEKIAAIEEMMATIPRHKGTEKMQADLKRRLSKLRAEQARRPTSRIGIIHRVEKEGAGQVALVGPPNSGKSLLVRRLTHATPEVADYPFTTRVPLPGMMPFEDVQVQLVDLPPVHPDFPESWLYQIIRNADAALLVVDLSDPDLLEDLETTLGQVANAKVQLDQARITECARLAAQAHPAGGQ